MKYYIFCCLFLNFVNTSNPSFAGESIFYRSTFKINTPYQAKNITATNIDGSSAIIKWSRGSGDSCVVFIKKNATNSVGLINNQTYNAIDSISSFCQNSNGWYCVYNGSKNIIKIKNLDPLSEYTARVFEYYGSSGSEIYNTYIDTTNSIIFKTELFSEQSCISIIGVDESSIAWGDYNNDGYLDFILTGSDKSENATSKIYKNNGNGNFTEQSNINLDRAKNSSSAWGDFDNDGNLDILISGSYYIDQTYYFSKIYHNNGNNTFTELKNILLKGVNKGSVSLGDLDNDGYLDILLTGSTEINQISTAFSKIYHNNGNNSFTEQTNINLTGLFHSSTTLVDFDNDGDLDIFLTGLTDINNNTENGITKIYINNGNNSFTEKSNIKINGSLYYRSVWGDFDNDGDQDILYSYDFLDGLKIYYNNGDGIFSEQTINTINGISVEAVNTGDFDNDGDLDLLIVGQRDSSKCAVYVSTIYLNEGGNPIRFVEQKSTSLTGVYFGSVAFGDYDNDGDLDILLTGNDKNNKPISKIYRNELNRNKKIAPNIAPAKPTGLSSKIETDKVILQWDRVKGDETPLSTLTYQVRVGSQPGGFDIVSPRALTNGFILTPSYGNAQHDTFFILRNLPSKVFYWSVQAIDQSYKGSEWAIESQFSNVKLSLNIIENKGINIYTTNKFINIDDNTGHTQVEVEILDIIGRTVYKNTFNNENHITVNVIQNGCYIVKVYYQTTLLTSKVIIQ